MHFVIQSNQVNYWFPLNLSLWCSDDQLDRHCSPRIWRSGWWCPDFSQTSAAVGEGVELGDLLWDWGEVPELETGLTLQAKGSALQLINHGITCKQQREINSTGSLNIQIWKPWQRGIYLKSQDSKCQNNVPTRWVTSHASSEKKCFCLLVF